MYETVADAERYCRDMAREFPTPNVLRAISLAESGRLSWWAIAALFSKSLRAGIEAVR